MDLELISHSKQQERGKYYSGLLVNPNQIRLISFEVIGKFLE